MLENRSILNLNPSQGNHLIVHFTVEPKLWAQGRGTALWSCTGASGDGGPWMKNRLQPENLELMWTALNTFPGALPRGAAGRMPPGAASRMPPGRTAKPRTLDNYCPAARGTNFWCALSFLDVPSSFDSKNFRVFLGSKTFFLIPTNGWVFIIERRNSWIFPLPILLSMFAFFIFFLEMIAVFWQKCCNIKN